MPNDLKHLNHMNTNSHKSIWKFHNDYSLLAHETCIYEWTHKDKKTSIKDNEVLRMYIPIPIVRGAYIYSNCFIHFQSWGASQSVLRQQFGRFLPNQLYSNSSWWCQEFRWGALSAGDGGSATVLKDNESGLMGWRRRRMTEIKYYAALLIFYHAGNKCAPNAWKDKCLIKPHWQLLGMLLQH